MRVAEHDDARGCFSQFDWSHWLKVRAERERLGLPLSSDRGAQHDHPIVGKTLRERESGITYRVESVTKDWVMGWVFSALLCNGNSHRRCIIEAAGCRFSDFASQAENFRRDFLLIQ